MSLADLMPLGLELSVLGLALIVFVADLLLGAEEKRGLGAFTVLGLSSILAASFFVDFSGQSFGVYESDGIGLYFKRVLLFAGIIGITGPRRLEGGDCSADSPTVRYTPSASETSLSYREVKGWGGEPDPVRAAANRA